MNTGSVNKYLNRWIDTRINFTLVIQTYLVKSNQHCDRNLRSSAGLWWTLRWLPVSWCTDRRWRHSARNVPDDPVPAVWQFYSNSSTANWIVSSIISTRLTHISSLLRKASRRTSSLSWIVLYLSKKITLSLCLSIARLPTLTNICSLAQTTL